MDIITAIKKRASIRAFLDKPVEQELIASILETARWAPSSKNIQPCHVIVVTGDTKRKISDALLPLVQKGVPISPDLKVEPDVPEKYHQRALAAGAALYQALHIDRDDKEKRLQQWYKNFHFFDAPVVLLFYTDNGLGESAFVDSGMFIQNVMLAALGFGLATCSQRSIVHYPDVLHDILGDAYQDKLFLTGMALGYADPNAPENNYRTARAELSEFVTYSN